MPRGERGQDPLPRSFLRLDPAPERYAQPKPPGSVSWDCRGPRACGVRSLPSDGGRGPPALPSPRPPPARPDAPRRLLVVVSEPPPGAAAPTVPGHRGRELRGARPRNGDGDGDGDGDREENENGRERAQGGDVDGDGEDRLGDGAAPAGAQRAPQRPTCGRGSRRGRPGRAGSPRLHLRGSGRVPGSRSGAERQAAAGPERPRGRYRVFPRGAVTGTPRPENAAAPSLGTGLAVGTSGSVGGRAPCAVLPLTAFPPRTRRGGGGG